MHAILRYQCSVNFSRGNALLVSITEKENTHATYFPQGCDLDGR